MRAPYRRRLGLGHSRGTAFVIRCEDNQPRSFSTWAAVALAGIGKLPATLADRSIDVIPSTVFIDGRETNSARMEIA